MSYEVMEKMIFGDEIFQFSFVPIFFKRRAEL
jgi:hypothetical protein